MNDSDPTHYNYTLHSSHNTLKFDERHTRRVCLSDISVENNNNKNPGDKVSRSCVQVSSISTQIPTAAAPSPGQLATCVAVLMLMTVCRVPRHQILTQRQIFHLLFAQIDNWSFLKLVTPRVTAAAHSYR